MRFLRAITRSPFAPLTTIVIVIITIAIAILFPMNSFDGCNLFLINTTEWLSGKLFVDTFSTKRIEFQRDTTTPTSSSAASGELLNE